MILGSHDAGGGSGEWGKALISRYREYFVPKRMTGMEAVLKVISFFIAVFMVANGIYVVYMPPYGDEMQGIAIIMMGVFIFIAVIWISRLQDQWSNT
jgi:hypothetical protein